MGHHDTATALSLQFEPDAPTGDIRRPTTTSVPRRPTRARGLCVLCGRTRARLGLARSRGQAPLRVCLSCHHAVMRHRRMIGAATDERPVPAVTGSTERPGVAPAAVGLIVPPGAGEGGMKYAALVHRRRRAQVAARRALGLEVAPRVRAAS